MEFDGEDAAATPDGEDTAATPDSEDTAVTPNGGTPSVPHTFEITLEYKQNQKDRILQAV